MHKKHNRIRRATALFAVLLCTCGVLLSDTDMWRAYAASFARPDTSGGQTSSGDTLNVDLGADTGQEAVMGDLSEGTYTAGDNGSTGTVTLDNSSVGGRMHVNIGQTVDLYAPYADRDYMDKISFSGNYTFMAAGGRGGNIIAKDNYAGMAYASGGYGSSITNNSIDYSSGQSITYRKGSNGASIPVSEATNTSYWDSSTSTSVLSSFMSSRINGGLAGSAVGWRAWSAVAQAGSASYIQVSGDNYIVAGGGAPGVVMFRCLNGSYAAEGLAGMHADVTPPLPAGCDGFYNPGSSGMSRRYRDYDGTNNINAGRIVGATTKNGIPVVQAFGGNVQYEDMFYGWVTNHSNTKESRFSNVYPGYSGLASRSGNKFSTAGMNDSAYSISVNSSATESSPYVKLKCNAKYITITNPTREGYDFDGWTCSPGVTVVSQTDSDCRFKVTESGATVTAKWKANVYWITFEGNGADGGSTPEQTCFADKTYNLNKNGFTKTGYTFAGWSVTPDGNAAYADQASVRNLAGGGTYVVLYAKWTANQYTVVFDPNGGTGYLDGITAAYDEDVTLPDGAAYFKKYTKDGTNVTQDVLNGTMIPAGETGADTETKAYESVFLGWALEDGKDLFTPQQLIGDTVKNLADKDGATVTLYAVWDDCPWIHAEDRYFTLKEAQSGYITYDLLMTYAEAEDREDGSPILPGVDESKGTVFTIVDYAPTDFTQFNASGASSETYQVVDSAGSVYKKTIMVYVVDTTPAAVKPAGTTRFINEYYYNQPYENGGLEDNSVWKTDPEYVAAIQSAFDNFKNDTPEMQFKFTHEDILEMKEFVRENGIGTTKYEDALERFFDRFLAPNRTR